MSMPADTEMILDNEDAYQMVAELSDKRVLELAGVDIHSGKHRDHGEVRVIIPAMGECVLLLPFVLQSALT